MKVLCSDNVVLELMNTNGGHEKLEETTRCKLQISNEGDYFPKTLFRTLIFSSDDIACISDGLLAVLQEIMKLGDDEDNIPPPPGLENRGKDPGEYIFRLCLHDGQSRAIIGPKGTTISSLRKACGCKVFIDNDMRKSPSSWLSHQMVRIIGDTHSVFEGLNRINEMIQLDIHRDNYKEWAQVVNFGEEHFFEPAEVQQPAVVQTWEQPAEPEPQEQSAQPEPWEHPAELETFEPRFQQDAPPVRAQTNDQHSRAVAFVRDLTDSFAGASARYCLKVHIVARFSVSMESHDFRQHLERETGAEIQLEFGAEEEDPRPIDITVAPLISLYHVHLLMLKRVQELQQEEERAAREEEERRQREAEDQSIAEMRAQIALLSSKVEQLLGARSSGHSKSKGKDKGKGKS